MLLRATVDASVLIERKCLEVNPIVNFDTFSKLKGVIDDKVDDSEWAHIFLPTDLYGSSIDLTEYLSIDRFEELVLLAYTKDKDAEDVRKLRAFYFSEATDVIYAIDFEYEKTEYSNKLKTVTIYDESGNEDSYKYEYKIQSDLNTNSYIQSLKLNLETKQLKQNIILNGSTAEE